MAWREPHSLLARRRALRARRAAVWAARVIVRRLAWAAWPRVYWPGGGEPVGPPPRPADARGLLAGRLAGRPAGAYAVRLGPVPRPVGLEVKRLLPETVPAVEEILTVDRSLVVRGLGRLRQARRYLRALAAEVGDIDAWHARAAAGVDAARLVVDAGARSADLDAPPGAAASAEAALQALAPEAVCVWVGDDDARPSPQIEVDALAEVARSPALARSAALPAAAAVVLGARHAPVRLPAGLRPWYGCGARLARWPVDVVMRAADAVGGPGALADLAEQYTALADPAAATLVREMVLLGRSAADVAAVLGGWAVLSAAVDRLADEPRRRVGVLAGLQRQAAGAAAEDDEAPGLRAEPRPGSLSEADWHCALSRYESAVELILDARRPGRPAVRERKSQRKLLERGRHGARRNVLYAARLCSEVLGHPSLVRGAVRTGTCARDGLAWDERRAGLAGLADHAAALVWTAGARWAEGSRNERWRGAAALIAARFVAGPCDAEWAGGVRAWVEACCERVPPAHAADRHAQAALAGLAMIHAAAAPSSASAAVATLGRHAGDVLEATRDGFTARRWPQARGVYPAPVDPVAAAGDLRDVCRFVAAAAPSDVRDLLVGRGLAERWGPAIAPALAAGRGRATDAAHWLARLSVLTGGNPLPRSPDAPGRQQAVETLAAALACADERLVERVLDGFRAVALQPGIADRVEAAFGFVGVQNLRTAPGACRARRAAGRRERFLLECPAPLDALVTMTPDDRCADWDVSTAVAYAASRAGWPDPAAVFRIVHGEFRRRRQAAAADATLPTTLFEHATPAVRRILLELAGGRLEAALRIGLADAGPVDEEDLDAIEAGWRWLRPVPDVRQRLGELAAEPRHLARTLRWLAEAGRCAKLPAARATRRVLADMLTDRPLDPAMLPAGAPALPADVAADLARLARLNADGRLPARLASILARRSRLADELRVLAAFPAPVPARVGRRIENLTRYLADPVALDAWVVDDLRRAIGRSVDDRTLAALEALNRRTLAGHVRLLTGVVAPPARGDPRDWENAIRLYVTVDCNGGLLRRLIRHEAAGDRAWLAAHPANRRFLDDLRAAGVDPAAWLGPAAESVDVPVVGRLTAFVETDPLHVLQMGNYFGTCLSVGGVNAFSTVANACEANKRVAYVRDAAGRVIGRRLLVITRKGRVLGFNPYGGWPAEQRPAGPADEPWARTTWVRALLDAVARRLADACGATLHPFPDPAGNGDEGPWADRALFARWYNDGPAAFDRWSLRGSPAQLAALVARDVAVREELARGLVAAPSPEAAAEAVRACLRLGDAALPAVEVAVARAGALPVGTPGRVLVDALAWFGTGDRVRRAVLGGAVAGVSAVMTVGQADAVSVC